MIKHLNIKGSQYASGYQLGSLIQESIKHRIKVFVPDDLFNKYKNDLPVIHKSCESIYSHLIEHLRGIADGAGVNYWKLFLLNCEELRDAKGCTTVAEVEENKAILSHNEDTGSKKERREDCFLVTHNLNNWAFTVFTYAGELPGSAYSWNSYGLFYSVNYLEPIESKLNFNKVPRIFTARAVIEAKNLEEAENILRSSPDASGYHYYLCQGNRILSIEQFQDNISIQEIQGTDVHTNHYIHPQFSENAPADKNSITRQKRAEELSKNGINSLNILTDRQDSPFTICRLSKDSGLTISTVQFLSHSQKIVIYTPLTLEIEHQFDL